MSGYTIELLPDTPIVVMVFDNDFQLDPGGHPITAEFDQLISDLNDPVFLLIDIIRVDISIDSIIQVANATSIGEKSLFHHPQIREILFITTDRTVRLALKGLNSKVFGNLQHVSPFNTLDEALTYAQR